MSAGQRAEPRVTAVVLAYGAEPWLRRGVEAVLASEKVAVDVVLVDNGCTNDDVESLARTPGVSVVRPERNLGFAGGCNAGAALATGTYLALVNADAVVEPTALAQLVEQAARPDVGIAGGSIRLADDPRLINSAGNPVHVLGISWAGRLGEPETGSEPLEVCVASGACLVLRRELWEQLGGFDAEYFAYHEDTELSLRVWRRGQRVVYVPTAVAVHRYEFSRNPFKFAMIERNRLIVVVTLWSWRGLVLLGPPLLALEAAMLVLAAKQGWLGGKVRGWLWLGRHIGHLRRRRRMLSAERAVPHRDWMSRLTPRLSTTAVVVPPAVLRPLNSVMTAYWRVAERLI
jgi:GT2 family glycosyltransferase